MSKAGGGIRSNKRVEVPVRTGQPRQGKNVRAVSQIGGSYGDHATSRSGKLKGAVERMENAPRGISVKQGNVAAKETVQGPGGSRTVMHCGSQHSGDGKY